jgi:hypothetical protein
MTMLFIMSGFIIFRSESLPQAWTMLTTMYGQNGWSLLVNDVPNRWHIVLFALPALFGPTSQAFTFEKLQPRPIYASIAATLFLYLVWMIGDEGYSEFIYFQF